jgi:hypothetical protein
VSDVISNLIANNGFWVVVGTFLGYGVWRIQERQKAQAARRALGSLLHGELVTMTPGARPTGDDPPTARKLVFSALPQLLAPGVIHAQTEWPLLMLLIRFNVAVENFNDKARTYNTAWASDQHGNIQRLCHQDLELTFWDYREAHGQLLHQIEEVGELGGPLPLGELRQPSRRQRLIEWWHRQGRIRKAR